MKWAIGFIFLICSVPTAQEVSLVFMGVIPGTAPEFEKRFEMLLQQHFVSIKEVSIKDFNDIRLLRLKTDFYNNPVITRYFAKYLREITNDNTLIVWVHIRSYSIEPMRRYLIGAHVYGSLRVTLSVYSLRFNQYVYINEIATEITKPLSLVFFKNVKTSSHITSSAREEIVDSLIEQTSEKISFELNGIIRTILIKSGLLMQAEPENVREPSVSDLFDIPSVEAPTITRTPRTRRSESDTTRQQGDTVTNNQ